MADEQQKIVRAIENITRLKEALARVIRGRDDSLSLVLTGLIANGHVLIEDYPGSGKTTLAKTLGGLIDCSAADSSTGIIRFRRIQFTPDLLPSDVLGVNVFDPKSASFHFHRGPVFAHIVLADEINRTGPKVQAAFLECMAERQVTLDNVTYQLDNLFFVMGTQNPLDMAGTYPLPLVQLDRFLLKVPMKYVEAATEYEIVRDAELISQSSKNVQPVISREDILEAQSAATSVTIEEHLLKAIVDICQATRNNTSLQFGASTRAAIMLKQALAAWALIAGRNYATVDDLKLLLPNVLLHRLRFHPGAGDSTTLLSEIAAPHLEKVITKVWE